MRLKLKYIRALIGGVLLISVLRVVTRLVNDDEGREIREAIREEGGAWKMVSTVAREWAEP